MPDGPGGPPPSPDVIQEAIQETAEPDLADLGTAPEADTGEPVGDDLEAGIEAGGDGDGDGPVVVKKKTRRGTRGGRNRRKKTPAELAAAADGEAGEDAAVAVVVADEPVSEPEPALEVMPVDEPEVVTEADAGEPAAGAAPEEDPGYVPMSEWLDDFDRR